MTPRRALVEIVQGLTLAVLAWAGLLGLAWLIGIESRSPTILAGCGYNRDVGRCANTPDAETTNMTLDTNDTTTTLDAMSEMFTSAFDAVPGVTALVDQIGLSHYYTVRIDDLEELLGKVVDIAVEDSLCDKDEDWSTFVVRVSDHKQGRDWGHPGVDVHIRCDDYASEKALGGLESAIEEAKAWLEGFAARVSKLEAGLK